MTATAVRQVFQTESLPDFLPLFLGTRVCDLVTCRSPRRTWPPCTMRTLFATSGWLQPLCTQREVMRLLRDRAGASFIFKILSTTSSRRQTRGLARPFSLTLQHLNFAAGIGKSTFFFKEMVLGVRS